MSAPHSALGIVVLASSLTMLGGHSGTDELTTQDAESAAQLLQPVSTDRGEHAYFETLQQLAQHHNSWSLRSQEQIDSLSGGKHRINPYFTYDPAQDDYHTPQDAAKYLKRAGDSGSVPIQYQLWMPVARKDDGSVLITWDWWWGHEWRTYRPREFRAYKSFQVQLAPDRGWWTISSLWTGLSHPSEVAIVSNTIRLNGGNAPGNSKRDPFTPTGTNAAPPKSYPIHHGRWVRHWVEVKYFQPPEAFTDWARDVLGGRPLAANPNDPQGRWHMISHWTADEVRGVQRLLFKAPVMPDANKGWSPWVGRFRFEMNTSQSFRYTHDMTAYGRNVVVLFDYELPQVPENDTFLFQKPLS